MDVSKVWQTGSRMFAKKHTESVGSDFEPTIQSDFADSKTIQAEIARAKQMPDQSAIVCEYHSGSHEATRLLTSKTPLKPDQLHVGDQILFCGQTFTVDYVQSATGKSVTPLTPVPPGDTVNATDATVKGSGGITTVSKVGASTQVVSPDGITTVSKVGDSTQIVTPDGITTVSKEGDSTQVVGPDGITTVSKVGDSTQVVSPDGITTVSKVGDSTQVVTPSGISTVSNVGGTAQVVGPSGITSVTRLGNSIQVVSPRGITTITKVGGTVTVTGPALDPALVAQLANS